MKRTLLFFLAVIVTTLTVAAQSSFKKYDIKSGVVTYDQVMKMGSFEMKKKVIVYFDDYGMRECRETYEDTKLQETYFSDGKDIYSVLFFRDSIPPGAGKPKNSIAYPCSKLQERQSPA